MEGLKKVYHPTKKVLTGEDWLYTAVKDLKNSKGTAVLIPMIDPDGNKILGQSVLSDPDWNPDNPVTNPITGEVTTFRLASWLIPHCYWEKI